MKKIFLKELRLKNFKGIVDATVEFFNTTNIFGANESGKSTLYTAFNWNLTGKDEYDRKDYEIKNTARKELNTQSHEVEAIIYTNEDGLEFEHKLKRVYLEKWVKQRGESFKTFEGHKTEFYYNDVPCNATEYQAKVDAIIPGNIIKLITNPYYFNTLPWEKQRSGLLQIAGNITNDEIFDSIATAKNDYGTLICVLNAGKTIEEYKKELSAKKKLLKDKSIEFTPRIDEAKRNRPEPDDWTAIEKEIATINTRIIKIDNLLADSSAALAEKQTGVKQKQHQLYIKQTSLQAIRNKINTEVLAKQNSGAGEISILEKQIADCKNAITQLNTSAVNNESNKTFYTKQLAEKDELITKLRAEWIAINKETFTYDECDCPTCGAIPENQVIKKKEELLENFNASVKKRKDDKVKYSNQVKEEKAQIGQKLAELNAADLTASITAERSKLTQLETKLSTLKLTESKRAPADTETVVNELMKVNGDALNLQEEIEVMQAAINSENEALWDVSDNEKEKEEKAQLQVTIDDLKKRVVLKEIIESADARIKQLMSDESANAQAIADLEKQEFEIETFTRAKMDILEKRVNGLFKYVKFRLFEVQVNEGIKETCVCEYLGVPYPTLNTAAKLLAGLDILETLSNFYGVHAPVFCDNRESVSWIPESKSQIISLFVSAADKKLRIEEAGALLKKTTYKKEMAEA